jgi:AraC-like DNA-binding protein
MILRDYEAAADKLLAMGVRPEVVDFDGISHKGLAHRGDERMERAIHRIMVAVDEPMTTAQIAQRICQTPKDTARILGMMVGRGVKRCPKVGRDRYWELTMRGGARS